MTDLLGWLGSICFVLSGIPQVAKCYKEKHAHGLDGSFLGYWLAGEVFIIAACAMKFGWVSWLMFSYIGSTVCVLVLVYYKLFPGEKE